MIPPLVSYSTFNRMGLTVRSITALLKTTDDFELHIIDNNSGDDTWDYIQSLSDGRIKSKTRFPINEGPIFAVNFNLAKRKSHQYFIALESDVYIYTPDWISRFMQVFETFPEVGLLGIPRAAPYPPYMPPVILREANGVSYLQLKNGKLGAEMDFIPGHCQCLRPELIDITGYWCEENGYGDAELSIRVNNYTPYRAGFATNITIDMLQFLPCGGCEGQSRCKLDKVNTTCFGIRDSRYKNESFAEKFRWKYLEYFNELQEEKRTVYCASIHDPASIGSHIYNKDWALENFNYYIANSN
ncbi:MAG: glycosyltransferase family 2 protein [Ruminiclostridium sp.]|nr:glycosyltransferase family 2 protein [Ruminiclostridium sp.]